MRISELARQTALPVATIKFYLREELLPAGTPISKTQSEYDETHVQRLLLIRSLREIAGLPVATIATVLRAVDDEALPLIDLLGITHAAVARPVLPDSGTELADRLLAELGWKLGPRTPLSASLAGVLQALAEQGEAIDAESLGPWIEAARAVAEVEVGHITFDSPRSEAAHRVTLGTVLYGALLSQLRLVAQEAVSLERFKPED